MRNTITVGFIQDEPNKIFSVDFTHYYMYEKIDVKYFYQTIHTEEFTQDGENAIKTAVSGDGKVIAIYISSPLTPALFSFNSWYKYGIRIFQYDSTLGYHTQIQFIPHRYSCTQYAGLSLNEDGTVFAIQHNLNVISVQSIFKRNSTSNLF